MGQYDLGVPSSSVTNTMGTPGIAGVNTSAGQSTSSSKSGDKSFLQSTGGMILTGGLGALIGGGMFGKSKLNKQMDEAMARIQNIGMSPEMQQAYQQSQMLATQGMDPASKQMAIQEQARNINASLLGLKNRRSALAGMPGLAISSGDFATRLAAQDAMMRRENKMAGIQVGMQFGQSQMDLEKSKAEAQYNALAAKKQARQQMWSSILSSAGQVAGAAIAASDYRLKEDITLIGKSEEGLNVYTFKYKGQQELYQGVMAQDLIGTKHEDAVLTMSNGMYAVDYSKLDVQFKQIN